MKNGISLEKQVTNQFEALYELAPLSILVVDSNNGIKILNPYATNLLGYGKDELAGKDIRDLIPEFQPDKKNSRGKNNLKNHPDNRLFSRYQSFIVKKNGHHIPVDVNQTQYSFKGIEYKVLFLTDYPARENPKKTHPAGRVGKDANEIPANAKHLEIALQELRKSKEHLNRVRSFQQKLLDTTGAMIIATDHKGIITLFNREASLKLGYDPEEIIGKETPVLFHSKESVRIKRKELLSLYGVRIKKSFDVLVEKARRNIQEEEQCIYVKRNGREIPVSLTITALRDSQGTVTGYVGVAIDISGRMEAEKELLKTRRLFLQLLDNYPDGSISIIDKDYRFVFTGGELHKLLQADASVLIDGEMYPNFPEPLRKIVFLMLEEVFREKKHITDFELPFPIHQQVYMMDAFPLIEADGSVNNAGVIIKNISRLKKAEESLREALKKEKGLGELKSRFVSMASHEFRTPLSTILSSAYLIEKYKRTEDQPRREVHFHRITSSVNMLTDILNEFLNIGKIEEGKIQARISEFNLDEFIRDVIDELKQNLKKDQYIQYQHKGSPVVNLDKSLLKHIILNLVSNASKFSPEKSAITVKTMARKGEVVLSVKDEGIGISREDQKHLAGRFFRGENATNIQGTGLGLYIVSKYAEMMKGTIKCKSEIDRGTEFILTFKISES